MNFLHIIDPNAPMAMSQALLVALTGIAVVLLELALLTFIIQIISKAVRLFSGKKKAPEAVIPAPSGRMDPVLIGVDEPTAAVIMAVISSKSGIPLEKLAFRTIRILQEEEK